MVRYEYSHQELARPSTDAPAKPDEAPPVDPRAADEPPSAPVVEAERARIVAARDGSGTWHLFESSPPPAIKAGT